MEGGGVKEEEEEEEMAGPPPLGLGRPDQLDNTPPRGSDSLQSSESSDWLETLEI